jgi:hypothetical protein
MTWSFTDIIAVLIALTLVYFTFIRARRPAWIQIVVIIGILGAGYWMWFMEPVRTLDYKGMPRVFQDPLRTGIGAGGY